MPIHQSAVKQIRKDKKRNLRNKKVKSSLKTAIKKLYSSITADEKQKNYKETVKLLDKAAQKKVIHWKNASRKKSRLAIHVNKVQKETPAK